MTVSAFLINHIKLLSTTFDIVVITNTDDELFLQNKDICAKVISIPIQRNTHPFLDLFALFKLASILRKNCLDSVFSVTPKAGLLLMVAGFIARVPNRAHMFTGQVWATRSGPVRFFLKKIDRLIVKFSTHLLADSSSQRDFLENERVVDKGGVTVLGNGSISGVDTIRFNRDSKKRKDIRDEYDIPVDSLILLFVGRLNKDKGVLDLANAFNKLNAPGQSELHLMVVGPDEGKMKKQMKLILSPSAKKRIHFVDFTDCPEKFMAAADIFCLPSYREGFGSVILEAAACGIPAVASRIYGLTDAVENGMTGLLHTAGDVSEMQTCLNKLINNSVLRNSMGKAARDRAVTFFGQEKVSREFYAYIADLF